MDAGLRNLSESKKKAKKRKREETKQKEAEETYAGSAGDELISQMNHKETERCKPTTGTIRYVKIS